jgi:hypothetical protein
MEYFSGKFTIALVAGAFIVGVSNMQFMVTQFSTPAFEHRARRNLGKEQEPAVHRGLYTPLPLLCILASPVFTPVDSRVRRS